jgi:hypothetical protein
MSIMGVILWGLQVFEWISRWIIIRGTTVVGSRNQDINNRESGARRKLFSKVTKHEEKI